MALLVVLSKSLMAKQTSFKKKELGDAYQFSYQWLDHQQISRELSFPLSKSLLFSRFRNFKSYQAHIAQRSINKRVLLAWRKDAVKNSQLKLLKQQGNYHLSITAKSEHALQAAQEKVNELTIQATNDYLDKAYYHTFTTPDNIIGIKPNHPKIVELSVEDFKSIKPLILEQVDLKNIRTATNYVLGFIQSVPYATLESRITSSGAGFNPPAKLLWENQGDCDSKVTLTATILRALMPRVKIMLVFIDGHALIGIETRLQVNDMTVTIDGVNYVLGEPTGSDVIPLGTISVNSKQAILNGMYVTQEIE